MPRRPAPRRSLRLSTLSLSVSGLCAWSPAAERRGRGAARPDTRRQVPQRVTADHVPCACRARGSVCVLPYAQPLCAQHTVQPSREKRREKQFARPAKEPRAQNAVGTLHVELCMWLPSFRLCGRGMGQADRWRRLEHASGVAREGGGPSKRSTEQSHLPERPLRNRGSGPQESAREANLTATLMQGEGTLGSVTRRTEPSAKSCESGLSRLGR